MSKHTPGPWTLTTKSENSNFVSIYTKDYGNIVNVRVHDDGDEQHANARLISAAPDLLALAKRYAGGCAECGGKGFTYGDDGVSGRGPDDVEPTQSHCPECEDIRLAIAKAGGV